MADIVETRIAPNRIIQAIDEVWGQRCSDYDESCPTCQAYEQHDLLMDQTTLIEAQAARIARLELALKPFGRYGDLAMRGRRDDFVEIGVSTTDDKGEPADQELTAGQFRLAARALNGGN